MQAVIGVLVALLALAGIMLLRSGMRANKRDRQRRAEENTAVTFDARRNRFAERAADQALAERESGPQQCRGYDPDLD